MRERLFSSSLDDCSYFLFIYLHKFTQLQGLGVNKNLIKYCKEDLAREFEMKDMGLMHYFIGMEVWQKDGEVFEIGRAHV